MVPLGLIKLVPPLLQRAAGYKNTKRYLCGKPNLFNPEPEVAVKLKEEETVGMYFVKRIKPWPPLLTGLLLLGSLNQAYPLTTFA